MKRRVATTLNEMATEAQRSKTNGILQTGSEWWRPSIGHSQWKLCKSQNLEVNFQIQNLDMRNGNLGNETVSRAQCFKEECVEISLVSMALETSWMTCTNRDEVSQVSTHSTCEIICAYPGPFWLKKIRNLLRKTGL